MNRGITVQAKSSIAISKQDRDVIRKIIYYGQIGFAIVIEIGGRQRDGAQTSRQRGDGGGEISAAFIQQDADGPRASRIDYFNIRQVIAIYIDQPDGGGELPAVIICAKTTGVERLKDTRPRRRK